MVASEIACGQEEGGGILSDRQTLTIRRHCQRWQWIAVSITDHAETIFL